MSLQARPALALRVVPLEVPELGNTSHLVIDAESGVAVAVDVPRVSGFVAEALERSGAELRWVLDTHLHNDFVSGGPELAARSGAAWAAPLPAAPAGARGLRGGDVIPLGAHRIVALHTPGHTPEHLSFLVEDGRGAPVLLLSGGSLLAGTMGRADLLGAAWNWANVRDQRATLRRLMELPDRLAVHPTHGQASPCGSGGGSGETATTIGAERRRNRLNPTLSDPQFVEASLDTQPAPGYYPRIRALNTAVAPAAPPPGSPPRIDGATALTAGAVLLDVRPQPEWRARHAAGSIASGLDGSAARWAAEFLGAGEPLVLVAATADAATEAAERLARLALDGVRGWTSLEALGAAGVDLRSTATTGFDAVIDRLVAGEELVVVDVRAADERAEAHLPGSLHVPLAELPRRLDELPAGAPLAVHCATGWRATLAAALLERAGRGDVEVIDGGPEPWVERMRSGARLWD